MIRKLITALAVAVLLIPLPVTAQTMGHIDGLIMFKRTATPDDPDQPLAQPMQGRIAILDARDAMIGYANSDENGKFGINLPPGNYKLRLDSKLTMSRAKENDVTVEAGKTVSTIIIYDSGR